MHDHFHAYVEALRATPSGGKTEFTDRTALHMLLESFATREGEPPIKVIAEPPRSREGYGTPDYRLVIRGATLGYVENKKIGANLSAIAKSPQIKKYNELSTNILITDYLDWVWLQDLIPLLRARLCEAADMESPRFHLNPEKMEKVAELIAGFLKAKPQPIGTPQEFARKLARPTQRLKEYMLEDLYQQQKRCASFNTLYKVYEDSLKFLSPEMTLPDFADSVAQTLSYSLFLAKLNAPAEAVLDLYNAKKFIPQSFHLIRALAGFLDELEDSARYGEMKWVLDEIIGHTNMLDSLALNESLTFREKQLKLIDDGRWRDPYIYFYEPFLHEYDKGQKVDRGVFYTPPSVVRFIVASINDILTQDFGLAEGLADKQHVTLLDFACGTGTFLLEVFKQVLDGLPANSPKRQGRIKDHILEHMYGFEYIVAPYTIAHLKLSQFLKENGYALRDGDRLKIYLTNTLETLAAQDHFFINAIHDEGLEAQKLKDERVLVITGNPPYNNKSQNPSYTERTESTTSGKKKTVRALTHIGKMLQVYKPTDETKLNLDDDYIKFIRFAHRKMEGVERGVIGIITNNSFLSGITHRRMRNKLMQDFSAIYILNLHGSSLIGETAPAGEKDENVFSIRVGTAISIFVKDTRKKGCAVYYRDLWGRQKDKYRFLEEHTIRNGGFEALDIAGFNRRFRATRWGAERFKDDLSFFAPPKDMKKLKAYGEFWGVQEIFRRYNSGIQTKRDALTIHFSPSELKAVFRDMESLSPQAIKEKYNLPDDGRDWTIEKAIGNIRQERHVRPILYRPFDSRWTSLNSKSKGFVAYPRYETMQHYLHDNVGLSFIRNNYGALGYTDYQHFMVHWNALDIHLLGGQAYTAPLYLYSEEQEPETTLFGGEGDSLQGKGRKENFSTAFRAFIDKHYKHRYAPEEVLGYLYAVLHSPGYRREYLEFLKIDFPRIPFVASREQFEALSRLGRELTDAHLLRRWPVSALGEPHGFDLIVEKYRYDAPQRRLYINAETHYADVPQEVWEFQIGGYQVLAQYLKYRKTRTLTGDEVEHVQKMIQILAFTIAQMQAIDAIWQP